jgi:hypothetical protein
MLCVALGRIRERDFHGRLPQAPQASREEVKAACGSVVFEFLRQINQISHAPVEWDFSCCHRGRSFL